MTVAEKLTSDRNVVAWLLMMSAIALHVLDEATSGFLPFYNQTVRDLKDRLGFFPAPTFEFDAWLTGLIVLIIVGFLATFLVRKGGRFIRVVMVVLGVLMVGNAVGHLGGSTYLGRILPGMWSSPLLLLAALYVVHRGIRGQWGGRSH